MLSHLNATSRHRPESAARGVDARGLSRRLSKSIAGEVRFDEGSRALYATDASNYRQVPIGVVIPRSIDDVIATVDLCREFHAPVLSRGCGTSLCGQCCNVAVVIDFSKYLNRILELDPEAHTAWVQPGVVLDDLRNAAERHGLTFAPDPSTHNHNTLGGMIGNNSCGVHSVMGGPTDDNVLELDVLTYEGDRLLLGQHGDQQYSRMVAGGGRPAQLFEGLKALAERYADEIRKRFPDIPRRVSGYNLPALLPEHGFNVARSMVGSEGTCVVILGAKVRLIDSPPARTLLVLGYPDVFSAGDHVPQIMKFGPIGLEGVGQKLLDDMKAAHLHTKDLKILPEGGGWLLVEFGAQDSEQAAARARHVMEQLKSQPNAPSMRLIEDPSLQKNVWEVRKAGLGATAHVPHHELTWEGWEDSSVPPARLGEYLRRLRSLLDEYDYKGDLYGHFGQGCVHTRINYELTTAAGIEKYREFAHDAARLVVSLGGSISGEHGDGQSKARLLPIMFGDTLMRAFSEFKALWDPQWKLNPGKVIAANRMDRNLRLGAGYQPVEVHTAFKYRNDGGKFSRALLRCVGVGECRKHDAGVMCPSYMATREEKNSTRGRARLLFEAMQGDLLRDGWRDESVRDALELCLSCKGCKRECPVHVDMATFKAEFLSHYYQHATRPRQAYAFGLIDRWAHLASTAPALANFMLTHEPFVGLARLLTGTAPQRTLPQFAARPFTRTFARRGNERRGRKVLLWADTFNNYWRPQILNAAVTVLEHAGFDVDVPAGRLCCGRPLYEFGMLDRAVGYLQNVLKALERDIDGGTPLVVLEPACAGVFRDELLGLLPDDERAQRLAAQTRLLSEFLANDVQGYSPPRSSGRALLHGHCIHKAVLDMRSEESLLKRTGLDVQMLDAGCCGMAGSFGFDKRKYQVSMKIAERALLPAVRSAAADTLIIADGFSCSEQIAQTTRRRALHCAEVLAMGLTQE